MKHVCVVTSAHPWDDVRVGSRIVDAFLSAGDRVTWVGPDKALFVSSEERPKDVTYELFPQGGSRADRLDAGRRAARRARTVRNVDWWYTPDPDMAARLPRLARRYGGRTLFDVHESYHGGLLNRWFPGGRPPQLVRSLLRRRIAAACTKVDLVIGVSRSVLDPYCAEHPHVAVVRNCAPEVFGATAGPHIESDRGGRMRVMHGKLAEGNGTRQVAHALELLEQEVATRLEVVMMDTAVATTGMREEINARFPQVEPPGPLRILPGVPHDRMAEVMRSCRVGVIAYQRDLGHESLPNRLFEYMATGLAIVAPSYSPEIVRILEEEQIGLAVDFESAQDIADALAWCVDHPAEIAAMGERARLAYSARHNWQHEADALIRAMRSVE